MFGRSMFRTLLYKDFGSIPWEFDFENFAKFLKMRGWRLYAWVFDSQNHPECLAFYADQFHI